MAFHSRSVPTIARIVSRIRSASPRWLPSNRAGRCTLRIQNAVRTPSATSVANTSVSNANHAALPRNGRFQAGSTIATDASRIDGSSTMNPQKIAACISPGTAFWKSLR